MNINMSRDQLLERLQTMVSKKRYKHILRVEETALDMAGKYQLDLEKVSIAALMHDYAKDMNGQEMLQLAQAYWPQAGLEEQNENIWHGFAAAQLGKSQFEIKDSAILNAIASHTIGNYQMDDLAQVICVADYIEPGRDFEGVDHVRKIAKDNVTQAMVYKLSKSLCHLIEDNQPVFEESIRIYNHWIKQTIKTEVLLSKD